jgi:DNA polymerase-3 subunit delta'
VASVFDIIVGQPHAVELLSASAEQPSHAYLFVGPAGSTKHEAARAFATRLLSGSDDPSTEDARLARQGDHPDIREVERIGASIDIEQAQDIVRLASLAPVQSEHKVIILHEFHLARPETAARLLKTIEEPPPSTIFLILADFVPTELVTIASRCTRIDFAPIPEQLIADTLVMEGVDPESAAEAAAAANGNLVRARLLAADPQLSVRRRAFTDAVQQVDGSGATVIRLTDELLELIEVALAPLLDQQRQEIVDLNERIKQLGERGSGKKLLEARHRREERRFRTDALRDGLSQMASVYRDALIANRFDRPDAAYEALAKLHGALAALDRNPNEALLMQSLLWSLPAMTD